MADHQNDNVADEQGQIVAAPAEGAPAEGARKIEGSVQMVNGNQTVKITISPAAPAADADEGHEGRGGRRRKSAKRVNKKRRSTKKSKGGKKSKRTYKR